VKSDSPAPSPRRRTGRLERSRLRLTSNTRARLCNYSCTLFTDCLSLSPVNERDTVAIIGTLTGPTVRLIKGGNPRGSLSPWHWAILAVVIIVLFGAKRLPDAARSLGKSMRIFKSMRTARRWTDPRPRVSRATWSPRTVRCQSEPSAPEQAFRGLAGCLGPTG
jgi:sec-independent protein translocase protein TatA